MKITDGFKAVDITMKVWDKQNNEWKFAGENLANEIFLAGSLPMNDEGSYIVSDVEYCIEQAEDWEKGIGDFRSGEDENEEHILTINELPLISKEL